MTSRTASQISVAMKAVVMRNAATARTSGVLYETRVGPEPKLGWFGICARTSSSSEDEKTENLHDHAPPAAAAAGRTG